MEESYFMQIRTLLSKVIFWTLNLAVFAVACAGEQNGNETPDYLLHIVSRTASKTLETAHLRKLPSDSTLSAQVFDAYFKHLDPAKSYFTQEDINSFSKDRMVIMTLAKKGQLAVIFNIYNCYLNRLQQYRNFVEEQLKAGVTFEDDEVFDTDRKKAQWCKNDSELKELWLKRLKNDLLSYRLMQKVMEEKSSDPEVKAELNKRWFKKSPADKVRSRLHDHYNIMSQHNRMDILGEFLTAAAQVYGPHSYYSTPKQVEDMDIHFSLSLTGIGATLTNEDGYVKIVNLVPGGPADKDGRLKVEDRIIAVTQENGETVDIIDMSVSNAVKHIRGEAGSKVTLTVLPAAQGASALPVDITIIRRKVELVDEAAKGEIKVVNMPDGSKKRIGVITLNSFYMDFEAASQRKPDYRSCTRDVRNILMRFNKEKIDALLFDMRNNSGGSLLEAISLSGLFITQGPIVQIIDASNQSSVQYDRDRSISYTGPMVVLSSKLSASSAEIFIGAMKDYRRALIVGDTRTFGKGTVLNVTDLGGILGGFFSLMDIKAGKLTYECAMFYRVNGISNQARGIAPDIVLPSFTEAMEIGEIFRENYLPWQQTGEIKLQPVNLYGYKQYSDQMVTALAKKSEIRRGKSPEYKRMLTEIKQFKKVRDRNVVSLNEKKRLKEYYEEKAASDKMKKFIEGEKDDKLNSKEKDIVLTEALSVAADYAELFPAR